MVEFSPKPFPDVSGKSSEKSQKSSGKTSGKIVALMRERAEITIPEIANALSKSTRAIELQVARLKSEGKIERIGPPKGGHWEVRGDD